MQSPRQTLIASQRAKIGRMAKPNTGRTIQHPTDNAAVIFYEGFHGILSRCHAVHRLHGNRNLFAFGIMENGGTSPTNMIEELATEMWKRFYPKDRFDRIEWFDAWPEHYSLTNRFHIQRVGFSHSKGGSGPVWRRIGANVPQDFVEEVRRVINAVPERSTAA
jgi:hypothetical protein